MKKLNLAIIGQGRSGKDIHGLYYRSEANKYYNVKYVVDQDEHRRAVSEQIYPGCKTFSDYRELFKIDDIDVVVNATYSDVHYEITLDLLKHGKNVLTEKPFARTRYECENMIKAAKDNGVHLAVFQQAFYAPIFLLTKEKLDSGIIGKVEQISIRYNGFGRRWDWQTLQKRVAGNAYNTGPHPIGMGLGFIDFPEDLKIVYSKLAHTPLCAGDSDDYAKILFTGKDKPLVDIEINSTDAFSNYTIKAQGSKGTYLCTQLDYKIKYCVDGENVERAPIENFLYDENLNPAYCGETFVTHTEEGKFNGTPFDVGTAGLYEDMYYALTEGRPMMISAANCADVIGVISCAHAENPLPVKF